MKIGFHSLSRASSLFSWKYRQGGEYVMPEQIDNYLMPLYQAGPYTGGEVGVVSHPHTGKQPRLVPPCLW